MGVMDKFLNYMKLNGDEDDDYLDDDYLDDEEEEIPTPPQRKVPIQKQKEEDAEDKYSTRRPTATNKITPIKQQQGVNKRVAPGDMKVCVIKPTSVEDAREITETLLANRTVVLNLEGLDVDVAQRIIDFTSGSCFAISGNLQKISHYIFIVTPASVDISGDFQDLFGGSFDMPINS